MSYDSTMLEEAVGLVQDEIDFEEETNALIQDQTTFDFEEKQWILDKSKVNLI